MAKIVTLKDNTGADLTVNRSDSLQDHGSTEPRSMYIGYSGNSLSSCTYLAAYNSDGSMIKDIKPASVTSVGSSIALKDKTNGTLTYVDYGRSGIQSIPTWIAGWDGYCLTPVAGSLIVATNRDSTINGTLTANAVKGAVANDYSDSIEINEDCNLEPGYCYCFNGEKYYKSTKYLDEGIIGIHSDTYAFNTGKKNRSKELDVAVSGFVLAYVDKIYKPGTPLTCDKEGYLTEISMDDKIHYPERIVGTFWKEEKNEIWEPETKNVKVNGRHWIKIK